MLSPQSSLVCSFMLPLGSFVVTIAALLTPVPPLPLTRA